MFLHYLFKYRSFYATFTIQHLLTSFLIISFNQTIIQTNNIVRFIND